MADWIGYLVSIKLIEGLGTYNGEIVSVTPSTISLIRAFHNGIPQNVKEPVAINSNVIESLKLIERKMPSPHQTSTVLVRKPVAKKAGHRNQNTTDSNNRVGNFSIQNRTRAIDEYKIQQSETRVNNVNNKRDKIPKGKYMKGWRDEECFGVPTSAEITKDFDFESNLALFDKEALWEQLSNNQKPDIIKQAESKRPLNYSKAKMFSMSSATPQNQVTAKTNIFRRH